MIRKQGLTRKQPTGENEFETGIPLCNSMDLPPCVYYVRALYKQMGCSYYGRRGYSKTNSRRKWIQLCLKGETIVSLKIGTARKKCY